MYSYNYIINIKKNITIYFILPFDHIIMVYKIINLLQQKLLVFYNYYFKNYI